MVSVPRVAEAALWVFGLGCVGLVADAKFHSTREEHQAARVTPHTLAVSVSTRPSAGALLGRIEIPDLGLTTPLVEGTTDAALLRGAGHIIGTAIPGGLGNFAIAAHRDTYFRPLSRIKAGMRIRVVTPEQEYLYIVDGAQVVLPQDVDVLDTRDVPQLTLVTCFPFHYVGAAPKRFVVTAHLASY